MRYESGSFDSLHFLLRYPQGYQHNHRHPAVLFLHGAGGRGTDPEQLKTNPFFQITDKAEDFPLLTFAPQCHTDAWSGTYGNSEVFQWLLSHRKGDNAHV